MANSNRGEAYLPVVRNLKGQLSEAKSLIEAEIQRLENSADSLSGVWQDEQYARFCEYIASIAESLRADLNSLDAAVAACEQELIGS